MLGESAGRGARHKVRPSARRRFNEEERAANTPLPDDIQEWPDEPRVRSRMNQQIGDIVWAAIAIVIMLLCVNTYNAYPDWRGMAALSGLGCMVAGLAIHARNH